jgi:hypothetical protein
MLRWAGILDLEMTVYYWREQVDKPLSGRIAKMEIGRPNWTMIIGQMR